ncbi:DUF4097 family beta strand repeat-containing protein [Secundilactobacillus silagei]|uniref:DUF4097 domain-containing protein n=1 Tax=Secundilactobacillus silagei JCM 19001 TaxID=1302250 RepID=A0A1Z5IKB9_9LACO|nr:DUF4097 family beta strand repeat-containing protein [Secundilactobacillus silagei]TDG69870.1 hypothetical protein C5L25_001990 [Secundilactobacillus silagei JCM 19001]GAX02136.1 hypothetical protein IWT126_02200 [Secundilactobacillus silagei JCM 19001]
MINDKLISAALDPIFTVYAQNDDVRDFYKEVTADVKEAAQALLDNKQATVPQQAVEMAVKSLGDLTEPLQLISSPAASAAVATTSATVAQSWSDTEVRHIILRADETQVRLVASADAQIHVHQFQQPKLAASKLQLKQSEDTLYLAAPSPRWFQYLIPFRHPKSVVEIALPAQFAGTLDVDLKSGSLSATDLTNQLRATLTLRSGGITMEHVQFKTLSAQLTSGSFKANHLVCETLSLNAHSGAVHLANVETIFDLSAHSGLVKGNMLAGAGQFDVHSGSLTLNWQRIDGDIAVINHSGTVKLQAPAADSFKFDLQAQSGTVKVTRNATYSLQVQGAALGQVGEAPQYSVTVKNHSGTIRLN